MILKCFLKFIYVGVLLTKKKGIKTTTTSGAKLEKKKVVKP